MRKKRCDFLLSYTLNANVKDRQKHGLKYYSKKYFANSFKSPNVKDRM